MKVLQYIRKNVKKMLNVISTDDFENLIKSIKEIDGEYVNILDSHGRILDEDIYSKVNIPGFKRSAVDGYAVIAKDTSFCNDENPISLDLKEVINIGVKPKEKICSMECSYIPTGGMLPIGADSIVMIEDTETISKEVFINKLVKKDENVVKENEDITIGDKVLSKGDLILSHQIAVLISLGFKTLKVKKVIKVGVLATGDELIDIDEDIEIPKVKESNGHFLTFASREDNCESKHYGIIDDNKENIKQAIEKALDENDLVFLSGGSSAGDKDFTKIVVGELGDIMFHGLSVKPGKPTLMAKCKNDKYIVVLPGHPLSCMIIYRFIALKLINKIYGKNHKVISQELELGEGYYKKTGREEYLPVKIENNLVYPIRSKSSAMSVMVRCDGIIKVDRDVEGYKKGDKVNVIRR